MVIKIEMTREEVCDLLGVTDNGLKTIVKRGQLKTRIDNTGLGYIYTGQHKEGRNTVYELEYDKDEIDKWKQFQKSYNIKDTKKHTQYTETRIDNLTKTRTEAIMISKTNIDKKTAKRYDDILLNENMIGEDKMVYVKHNLNTKEFVEITKDEYSVFWKDSIIRRNAISDVYKRKAKGEYSEDMATHAIIELTECSSVNGWIAYKFMSYKELDEAKKLRQWLSNRKK